MRRAHVPLALPTVARCSALCCQSRTLFPDHFPVHHRCTGACRPAHPQPPARVGGCLTSPSPPPKFRADPFDLAFSRWCRVLLLPGAAPPCILTLTCPPCAHVVNKNITSVRRRRPHVAPLCLAGEGSTVVDELLLLIHTWIKNHTRGRHEGYSERYEI